MAGAIIWLVVGRGWLGEGIVLTTLCERSFRCRAGGICTWKWLFSSPFCLEHWHYLSQVKTITFPETWHILLLWPQTSVWIFCTWAVTSRMSQTRSGLGECPKQRLVEIWTGLETKPSCSGIMCSPKEHYSWQTLNGGNGDYAQSLGLLAPQNFPCPFFYVFFSTIFRNWCFHSPPSFLFVHLTWMSSLNRLVHISAAALRMRAACRNCSLGDDKDSWNNG